MVSSRPIPENQLSSYVVKNANLRWGTALEITPSQVKIPATQSFIDSWKDAHIYHEKLPVTSGFNDMEPPKRAPEPIATLPLVAESTTRNKEPPLSGSNLQAPETNRHDKTPVPVRPPYLRYHELTGTSRTTFFSPSFSAVGGFGR